MKNRNGREWKDAAICQHYFEDNSNYYGAVTPPIVQTTLFTFDTFDAFIEASNHERENHLYCRGVNPTTEILEKKLAMLECGEQAKVFGSGMGAISATLFTLLAAGDHILLVNNVYGPATIYSKTLEKFHVECTNVFVRDAEEIEQYVKPNTKIIYYESPSTQMMYMLDIDTIVDIARRHHALTMTDNTWSTPFYQKPLTHGVDIVIHSCTKYIGGHSDVMAGAVISRHEIVDRIFEIGHQFHGAAIGPFEAWLLIRGLRSLEARLEHQARTTQTVVDMLKNHPMVKTINHPLCFTGKQKELADQYLTGYTSLLSIDLNTEAFEDVRSVADACEVFQIGVSWGGFESLILPQNHGDNDAYLKEAHIPGGLIRIYLGMEPAEDLAADLKQALDKIMK